MNQNVVSTFELKESRCKVMQTKTSGQDTDTKPLQNMQLPKQLSTRERFILTRPEMQEARSLRLHPQGINQHC